ncbi:MAG: tryptophan 7-halogenase, partial [Gemmatimonadaceae bacterium]|nr:tryptophan 7-halogenase [Caulobacter sp.]
KHRPPNAFDFPSLHESFKYFNYQYVLYGMGFATTVDPAAHVHGDLARADFAKVREAGLRAAAGLPDHRALLNQVYTQGFTTKVGDAASAEAAEGLRR